MGGWADVVVVDEEEGRTNLEEEDNKGDIGGEIKIEFSDTGVDVGFFLKIYEVLMVFEE